MSSLKKFNSIEEFNIYRNQDGWDYPAVNIVKAGDINETHYNNELRMRWYSSDTAKVPVILGDLTHDKFVEWVKEAAVPCEIKNDGTDFSTFRPIYALSNGKLAGYDYSKRNDSSGSHYDTNTDDYAINLDYLQMVVIKNINVGLFENKSEGWKEVRFNLDKGCPKGFHRWFPEEKKLFGRYVNFYQSGDNPGVNICKSVGYTNSNVIKSGSNLINQNNSNLLFMTYWEYLVLQYIMCAYYKSFNIYNDIISLDNKSTGYGDQKDNNITTSIDSEYGRFFYIEGIQSKALPLWLTGIFIGEDSKYYMTYSDISANWEDWINANRPENSNEEPMKNVDNFPKVYDVSGNKINVASQNLYVSDIDLFAFPTEMSGTSSSGFYGTSDTMLEFIIERCLNSFCGLVERNYSSYGFSNYTFCTMKYPNS